MRRNRHGRFGILFHGGKIWISELNGLILVITLSTVLISLSVCIIRNEYTIYRLTRKTASSKSDKIILSHFLTELRQRVAIGELLCSIAKKKLSNNLILKLSDIVYRNSIQFGYDPLLLLAVIKVESLFETNAVGKNKSGSPSGALGLMQLKPATAKEMASLLNINSISEKDLFKPEINVVLGVAYLTSMISRFKSFKLGLIAYNQGPQEINRVLSEKKPLSLKYYQNVLRSYYELRKKSAEIIKGSAKISLCR